MQQYFHLTGVLGRWLYAARRLALLERAIGSKPPRRWLYLAVFRIHEEEEWGKDQKVKIMARRTVPSGHF